MLNPDSPIPLYRQLADILLNRIRSGRYVEDSRIPSEPKLATEFGVGRPTVRQAVEVLAREGILRRKKGSGTYVQSVREEVDLLSLGGTTAAFAQAKTPVKTRILTPPTLVEVEPDRDNPFSGSVAWHIRRLSMVQTDPVLLEVFYMNAELFAGIEQMDIRGRSLSRIVKERFYMTPSGGRQTFSISYVSGQNAANLGLAETAPVLEVNRYLDFPNAASAVFARLFCRTDRFVFSQKIGGKQP
jgi:GntR family transcriptional regulator